MRNHSKILSTAGASLFRARFPGHFLVLLAGLSLAACHGDHVRGLDASADVPTSIDFGLIPVNAFRVRPLTVGNTGAIALTVNDSQVAEPFGVEAPTSAPVDPGATQQMLVSFVPIAAGEINGTLTLLTSSIANPNVTVQLHGVAYTPVLGVDSDRLEFGDVNVGESKTLTFVITNKSPAPLNPNVRPQEAASDYSVAPQGDLGALQPQQTVTVSVAFSPSRAGEQDSSVVLRCPVCATRQILLTGNGVGAPPPPPPPDAGPGDDAGAPDAGDADAGASDAGAPDAGPTPECALSVTPLRIDFPQLAAGSTERSLITITATGSGSCFVQMPFFAQGSSAAFGTLEPLAPFQLSQGQTATLRATFSPTAQTLPKVSGSLVFVSNDHKGPSTVVLTGTVTSVPPPPPPAGKLVVAPASLSFKAQAPSAPASQQLSVLNSGGQSLTFTAVSDDPQMTLDVGAGTLAPGQTAMITVSVAAQPTPGMRSQTITVDALTNGHVVVPVQITFNLAPPPPPAPAQLVVTPLTLDFTAQTPSAPPPQTLTIGNSGGLSLSWVGSSADPSVSLAPALGTVQGSGSVFAQVSVAAQPFTGTRTSTLLIDAGAAGKATVTLNIVFTAPPPPPPPPQYGASAWPKWHHGNTNTGLSSVDTTNTSNNQIWATFVSAPVPCLTDSRTDGKTRCGTYVNSPVLAADGTVIQLGGDGMLNAFDPASGAPKWSSQAAPPWIAANEGTPTVVADGSIFLMTAGEDLSGKVPEFYKFDQDGNPLWHNTPGVCDGKKCDGFDSSPALGDDGTLYFSNDDNATIVVHDQRGNQTSHVALVPPSDIETQSGALAPDNIGYWSANGHLWALSSTATLWSFTDPNSTDHYGNQAYGFHNIKSSPAVSADGKVIFSFVYEKTSSKGVVQQITMVHAFRAGTTLKKLWSRQLGPTTPRPGLSPGGGLPANYADALHYRSGITSPAIGPDGTIYVGHCDGLYAIKPADGTLAGNGWPFATAEIVSSPAVGAEGTVYVGSMDGYLYAINPDGSQKWAFQTAGQLNSSPAIGLDGTIYAMSDDGFLYAVR